MTSAAATAINEDERITRLEDPAPDFPFYNGAPTSISNRQWLFVLAMVVAGFLALSLPWPQGGLWPFVPAALLPGLPLLALAYVAPGHWQAIFAKVGRREVKLMIGFALLNIVLSMSVGTIVGALTEVTTNTSTAHLGDLDLAGRIIFFARIVPQLFGEEVLTLLPFLALLQWCTTRGGMGRKSAILVTWLTTSLIFGLLHLPTYDWNWIQCLVIIGSARVVLTLPWILTKNLWVSTGAHVLNDWMLSAMSLLGAALVGKM